MSVRKDPADSRRVTRTFNLVALILHNEIESTPALWFLHDATFCRAILHFVWQLAMVDQYKFATRDTNTSLNEITMAKKRKFKYGDFFVDT